MKPGMKLAQFTTLKVSRRDREIYGVEAMIESPDGTRYRIERERFPTPGFKPVRIEKRQPRSGRFTSLYGRDGKAVYFDTMEDAVEYLTGVKP